MAPTQGPSIEAIDDRIASRRDALTPAERDLAASLVDDPTTWAFSTVAELAESVGTSGPTVVRFAVSLGFAGFGELQGRVRGELTDRLRRPIDRLRGTVDDDTSASGAAPLDHALVADAIAATFERLDDDRIDAVVDAIAGAEDRVWIVASESSSPVAHLLATNLSLLRPGVVHLTGSGPSTGAAIADASGRDAAVAVDFPRYEQAVVDLAGALAERGVLVTALTDGPLSPLVDVATAWCGVVVPSVGPFDSATSTIALAEVIIARVAARLGGDAAERLVAVERRWAQDGVFVPSPTRNPRADTTSR
ncbi:MAG: MurR/RpiR family transcriptional regulator, partial [Ilumatobacter sp.]